MQLLVRMDQLVDRVRGQGRLGEARQDQLELARVGRDVADGENAGLVGLAGRRIDGDKLAIELEAPVRDRPELHRQPEKGQQHLGLEPPGLALEARHHHRLERAVVAFERVQLVGDDDLDHRARRGQGLHARHAFRGAAELGPTVDHVDLARDLGQREHPVERRIPAAGDDHALAPEVFAARDHVEHALAFVALDTRKRRPVRPEGAATGGDDHGARVDPGAARGLEPPAAAPARDRDHLLPQVIDRREGRGLLGQARDQLAGHEHRTSRYVVDRLVRIECRALAADRLERIDQVTLEAQHTALEDGEQTDGSGADDGDVCRVDGRGHSDTKGP